MIKNLTQEILKIEENMATAFNQREVEKVLSFIDPNFIGFSSTTHGRIQGLDGFRKTIEYYLDESERVEYSVSDIQVTEFDPLAIATFHWVVIIHHGSHKHEIPGRGTHVFRETSDGLKIIHEHFSRAHHQ